LSAAGVGASIFGAATGGSESIKDQVKEILEVLKVVDKKMDTLIHQTKINDLITKYDEFYAQNELAQF